MRRGTLAALALLAACDSRASTAHAPIPPPVDAARPAAPPLPAHRAYPTAADALRAVLADHPRVLGVGEYHQTEQTAAVRSAVARFSEQMLPVLGGQATDLVVETWAEHPDCDARARRASAEVVRDMERPPATEDEVVGMLRRAVALHIRPHLLPFDCADYEALLGADGQVDYEKLLLLVTGRLRDAALAGARAEGAVVIVYGGALHNDLYPAEGVGDFSYAREVDAAAGGRYVELDLVVPEYVAADAGVAREPWAPLLAEARPDGVMLIERGPRAYSLVLETTPPQGAAVPR